MTLSPLEAYETVMRFARDRGELPLRLAMHVAIASSFRPSFLHLTRLNYVPESSADPSVEADVLLAPFCQPIGAGYYDFDSAVRALLLDNLQDVYAAEGRERLRSLAMFFLTYLDDEERRIDSTQDRLSQSYIETERWVALAIVDPDEAAQQLAVALNRAAPAPQSVARLRVGGLVHALAAPLLRYPQLADYALGIEALERGDRPRAAALLARLPQTGLQVGAVTLRPARAVLDDWGLGTTAAPEIEAVAEHGFVYVAHVTGDGAVDRARIIVELRVHGYRVLPEESAVAYHAATEQQIRADLGRCTLSVHVVGRAYDDSPEAVRGENIFHTIRTPSVPAMELAAAKMEAVGRGLRVLVWSRAGADDARQRERLLRLSADAPSMDVLFESSIAGVVDEMLGTLRRMERRNRDSPAGSPIIYLQADRSDLEAIEPIRDYLAAHDLRVVLPLFGGPLEGSQEEHRQALRRCQGSLLYWGAAADIWLYQREVEIKRQPRSRRPLFAIFAGLPETTAKHSFSFVEDPGFMFIRHFAALDPETLAQPLAPFVEKVRARPPAG